MTQERNEMLFYRMLNWICENTNDQANLFSLLHNQFEMSQEELHACCIGSLDKFFPQDACSRLKEKVLRNYEEYKAHWLQMEPIDLIEQCDQVEGITRMMQELTSYVREEDAEYLLRFKNPLEVVSDEWIARNGMDSLVIDNEMTDILWQLRDKQAAEEDYELETDSDTDLTQQM